MRRTPLPLVLLLAWIAPSAAGQCGDWQSLGPMYSLGYAGNPAYLAADEASQQLYGVAQCYCGWHGINLPTVHSLGAAGWSQDLTDFEQGVANGIAFLDDGTGPALYLWGSQQSWQGAGPFMKLAPGGWLVLPTPTGTGIPTAVAAADDGTGRRLYFGGYAGVARFQGAGTEILGAAAGGYVYELFEHDDGSGAALYAAGTFTSIGGVAANRIARWDGATWHALGAGLGPTTNSVTLVARSVPHGLLRGLYVGGDFATAGGVVANGIARWDGTSWQGIGASLPGSMRSVRGLEWFDAGRGRGPGLVASGTTTTTAFLAHWNGTQWEALPALPNGAVPTGGAIAAHDRPQTAGRDLVVFGRVNPDPQYPTWFETWTYSLEACDLTGELTCFGDGSFAACPCGNESAVGERVGCLHSQGVGASLRARGAARISSDSLVLHGTAMPDSSVLYFQGANASTPVVFGDGVKCTGGPFLRLGTQNNVGGASSYPAAGDLGVAARGLVAAPGTRWYQARFRNSADFCTSATFNYTNGVAILWSP